MLSLQSFFHYGLHLVGECHRSRADISSGCRHSGVERFFRTEVGEFTEVARRAVTRFENKARHCWFVLRGMVSFAHLHQG